MISIIKQRKIWFVVSSILVTASLLFFGFWGLKLGIDFTGGSLLEVEFSQQRPDSISVSSNLQKLNIGDVVIQPSGDKSLILRFKEVNEQTHQEVINSLKEEFTRAENPETGEIVEAQQIEEMRFNSIGPTIGQELKDKTFWAIGIVLVAIIFYIAWAFRKVSKPIASWKYGIIAVIALFHDVIITIGIFSVLGKFYGVEVNAPFIAALLTILGYSVNDTIVVFDRTRENLIRHLGEDFDHIVQKSINQVITRSINTSLTTLVVLFSILLLGGSTIRDFVLALIIGVSIGTYSSVFLASPLLVAWEKFRHKE